MLRHCIPALALTVGTLLGWSLPAQAIRPLAERRIAADMKHCTAIGDLAYSTARARDEGVPLKTMLTAGILPVDTPETIKWLQMLSLDIYALPRLTPADIKQLAETNCLRERINARQP